jgi:hypothetical protein
MRKPVRYHVEEHYRLKGDRKHVQALFDAFDLWVGTSRLGELVDDLDMGVSLGVESHLVEFTCSVEVTPHTNELRGEAPFNYWAAGVGEAAQEAHGVVQAFISDHEAGHWEVIAGQTTVASSSDGEDIENAMLVLTIQHAERDFAALSHVPDPAAWMTHYSQ